MKAYPNPAQQKLTVEFTGMAQERGTLQLVDALGRVVKEEPCTGSIQELDVAALPNGIYTLVYKHTNGKLQTRVSISR